MAEAAAVKKSAAAATPADAAAEPAKPDVPAIAVMAPAHAIRRQELIFNVWAVKADEEHSLADVLNPAYLWRRATEGEMKAGDEFVITHKLHAFIVRGYIIAVDRDMKAVSYKILPGYPVDLTKIDPVSASLSGAVVIRHGANNWCVQRGAVMLKGGFQNEAEANVWLMNKQKQLAALGAVA